MEPEWIKEYKQLNKIAWKMARDDVDNKIGNDFFREEDLEKSVLEIHRLHLKNLIEIAFMKQNSQGVGSLINALSGTNN